MTDAVTIADTAASTGAAGAVIDTSSAAATFGLTGDTAAATSTGAAATGDTAASTGEAKATDTPAPLAMPGKGATPEQWGAFYAQLGRPETPEGYELPLPEGDDGEFAKKMAPMLHKHGLSAEQAKGLAGDWNAMVASQQAAMDQAEAAQHAAQKAQNEAESTELRNEWGQQNDANMHFAKQAVQQFLPKGKEADVISAIESKVGYKATIQFLHSIGKGLAESDAAGLGEPNAGGSRPDLAQRLYPSSTT